MTFYITNLTNPLTNKNNFTMKIAIHHRNSLGFFSSRWIEFCKKNNIEYKLVNAYDNDIIQQIKGCDAFMWHFSNYDYRDAVFAKQLIFSLEQGRKIKVFPNFNTVWHFDDKVGEMYMLQSIGAPIVPSYVFYTKKEALEWSTSTSFPKVAKLRGGSGSSNVKLIKTKQQAKKYIKRAFSKRGFSQVDWREKIKFRFISWTHGRDSFVGFLKSIAWAIIKNDYDKMHPVEKGYAYFQDFIPDNTFDIRVCVVNNRAFALKRMCREGDFRASGGGRIVYDKTEIDERCVKIALETSKVLQTQSIAFDFVFKDNTPLIVETSYGFAADAYDKCEGYWDDKMNWHAGSEFDFCGWMVEEIIHK